MSGVARHQETSVSVSEDSSAISRDKLNQVGLFCMFTINCLVGCPDRSRLGLPKNKKQHSNFFVIDNWNPSQQTGSSGTRNDSYQTTCISVKLAWLYEAVNVVCNVITLNGRK